MDKPSDKKLNLLGRAPILAPRKNFKPLKEIRGVNRLIKDVESEYSHNILTWFENFNKITFFGVYSEMAEKHPSLIFFNSFLNFCKSDKN